MLTDVLFPDETGLQLDEMEMEGGTLILVVSSRVPSAICPTCQKHSQRPHSCYRRQPADLPIAEQVVQLEMVIQRFFSDNRRCKATTCAERLPEFIEPDARRTNRLKHQQQQLAFEVNAKRGESLLDTMHMPTSHDTLVRLVRAAPDPDGVAPRVVGIDDWSKRKGQTYGTILVELERHTVVDVLDERSAESAAEWFGQHPGIEVISRDRGNEYIQGATKGAPDATQVADRWHLLKNLREALERLLQQKPASLKAAASEPECASSESAEEAAVEGTAVEANHGEGNQLPEPDSSGCRLQASVMTKAQVRLC